jgi:integrase
MPAIKGPFRTYKRKDTKNFEISLFPASDLPDHVLIEWRRVMGDTKSHKTRDTIFPEQLQEAIRELWKAYGQHEFVFSYKDGTIPKASYIRYWLPRWLEKAKIDLDGRRIVPHSSRHSTASILEADGVSLRYIQNMLGHARMETTQGYLHEPAGTMNRIGKKMSEVTKREEHHDNIRNIG